MPEQQQRTYTTDEFETLDRQEQKFTRYIDVLVTDVSNEQAASVESDLETVEEARDEQAEMPAPDPIQQRAGPQRRRRPPAALLVLCLSCLLIAGFTLWYIFPLFTPGATITIVTTSKVITLDTSITVIAGQADAAKAQITGRSLPTVSMSQAVSVPTTGTVHQDAHSGHGLITFYNAAPYAQIVSAGTLITGADGIQIVTDEDATIPAVSYPTLGQATVSAHATMTGKASNIQAGDIYGPCCRLNLSAVNSAFNGGQDARTYQTATSHDISNAATQFQASLEASVQAALQAQVHTDETLLMASACQPSISSDHRVGEEAQELRVTVNEACSGEAVKTDAYQSLLAQLLNREAIKQVGDGYALAGTIASNITKTRVDRDRLVLAIHLAGTYAYQFTGEQQQQLKMLLAGKSRREAMSRLLREPGVASAEIVVKNNAATLPIESRQIVIVVLAM